QLFVERNYLYCAQGHPLFERALGSLPLSELRNHAFAGRANSRVAGFYRNLSRRATCNGADLIAMLISTGSYIGFLPEHFVSALAASKQFRPIMPAKVRANIPVYLVSRRNLDDMRMAQAFVQTLRKGRDTAVPRTSRRS
ncbi:MAG TPA: LysR substrate-binding domain-containing protein, partial [Nordella sp.]|nr:LysR substrate-binding domain-containing protein [Nordella sp.]